ncbi:hypothetical protein Tco_0682972 [Tanacetum coccineum]|uniref:Uncharacterized protein n=1 Tax=Tanacetum coccineum TaxID=301880 RepID=A0ABQ4XTT7_9ASTR
MKSDHKQSRPSAPQRQQDMSVENALSGLVPQGHKASAMTTSDPVPPRQNVFLQPEKTISSQQGRYKKSVSLPHATLIIPCAKVIQPQSQITDGQRYIPLEQVREIHPCQVQTRQQLATDLSEKFASLGKAVGFSCPRSTPVFSNLSDGRENGISLNGPLKEDVYDAHQTGSVDPIIKPEKVYLSESSLYGIKASSKTSEIQFLGEKLVTGCVKRNKTGTAKSSAEARVSGVNCKFHSDLMMQPRTEHSWTKQQPSRITSEKEQKDGRRCFDSSGIGGSDK